MDHKQRVNKKQNVEAYSPFSSGGQGKYTKFVSFLWSSLEAALSVGNLAFVKKQFFCKELIGTKGTVAHSET